MDFQDDSIHSNELSDEELNEILFDADQDLLDYIKESVDPSMGLSKVMGTSSAETGHKEVQPSTAACGPGPGHSAAVIMLRARARSLVRSLREIRNRARQLLLSVEQIRNDSTDRNASILRASEFATELPSVVAFADDLAQDVEFRRDVEFSEITDRALNRSRVDTIVNNLDRSRDLDLNLIRIRMRARLRDDPLAQSVAHDQAIQIERELFHALAQIRHHTRELVRDLDRAIVNGNSLVERLDATKIDVSDEDLTHLDLSDVDALKGVIWTRKTSWPSNLADEISKSSHEIKPGIYRNDQKGDSKNASFTKIE